MACKGAKISVPSDFQDSWQSLSRALASTVKPWRDLFGIDGMRKISDIPPQFTHFIRVAVVQSAARKLVYNHLKDLYVTLDER